MTTAQKISKLESEVRELRQLFSALVPADTEGKYKDSFVKQVKKTRTEKSVATYAGKGSLLNLK
jgi:hypothetical protein